MITFCRAHLILLDNIIYLLSDKPFNTHGNLLIYLPAWCCFMYICHRNILKSRRESQKLVIFQDFEVRSYLGISYLLAIFLPQDHSLSGIT